ncbi:transporter [Kribbella albertanoniae]|uniref:ABC transporter permease n=1 Tax=Kribbella albertanoniae TaxID=1266829 RepID=A0A4V2XQ31_9ACTN|nr:ABC transporter permease subunit [Kribbella albertanoniae]TDC24265.1 ABC transporter permease [Kribbella albertanoniae]
MIWLTWRQFRVQFLVIASVVLAAAVLYAATGPGLADDYQRFADNFIKNLAFARLNPVLYQVGLALLYAVPPIIGAFWGAPLIARELETGTHRLVWGQSISRWRWLATKVGVGGLGTIVVTGALSLAVTWWSSPIDKAINAGQESNFYLPRMFPVTFSGRGLVPIGYAVFAFALGVAIGLAVRRTLVALAVTLAVVILVQILAPTLIRPHLMAPTDQNTVATADNLRGFMISGPGPDAEIKQIEVGINAVGGWKLTDETVDKSGKVATLPKWVIDCEPNGPNERATSPKAAACFQRMADEGYSQHVRYFTADKFWALQWREFGLFLLLAFGLLGFTFWRIRRDLS